MLKGLAWDTDNAEEKRIKELNVEFTTRTVDWVQGPLYQMKISGYEGINKPFRTLVNDMYEYAKDKYPREIGSVNKANGGADIISIGVTGRGLKPLVDILYNGFIQKYNKDPERYKLNFKQIMEEAVAALPEGVKVKKIWYDETTDGHAPEGQGQSQGEGRGQG